jgi:hypothetical protein
MDELPHSKKLEVTVSRRALVPAARRDEIAIDAIGGGERTPESRSTLLRRQPGQTREGDERESLVVHDFGLGARVSEEAPVAGHRDRPTTIRRPASWMSDVTESFSNYRTSSYLRPAITSNSRM